MINTKCIMSLIVCNNSINNVIENVTTAFQSRSIDRYKDNQDIKIVIKVIDLS